MSKNENKKSNFLFSGKMIFAIQLIISGLLTFLIYKLGIFPKKHFLLIIGVIALMLLVFAFLLLRKSKSNKPFSKILSLLLSLLMVFGAKYIIEADSALTKITDANKDTYVVSVVVKKDSPYESINDVKSLPFAANVGMDKERIDNAVDLIKKEYGFEPTIDEYTRYPSIVSDLLNGNIPVMLLSEEHRARAEIADDSFTEETKVIGNVSYEKNATVVESNVNITKETFSIYLTGLDTYGSISTVSRSDVNMVITVNPSTGQILLTSIPRDYHVKLGTIGAYDKLTHAGIYGVGESVATLENLLDTKIDYYAKVNFSSVVDLVDYLGGVDVYSQYTFTSRVGNHHYQKGINTLTGQSALAFVRERYALPGGDNDRIKNQQELLIGMLKKIITPSALFNYSSILKELNQSIQMSILEDDFKSLIKFQLATNTEWDIQQYLMNGRGSYSTSTYSMPGWNLYVMEPNSNSVNTAKNYISDLKQGKKIIVE